MTTFPVTTSTLSENSIELEGANKTLLLPLWARAKESKRSNPIIIDNKASQIVDNLSQNEYYLKCFMEMEKTLDKYYELSQLIRAKCIDDEVRTYIKKYPAATIINIGAGFDTTFERVDNGKIFWYDLDLPEVIDLRRKYIPETDRNKFIAKSIIDPSWFDHIHKSDKGIMIISCGVLFFLNENQVKELFKKLLERFPGCEVVFDTMSRFFIMIANRIILKQSKMSTKPIMQWGIKSIKKILNWDEGIHVITKYPMFSTIPFDKAWGKSITTLRNFVSVKLISA